MSENVGAVWYYSNRYNEQAAGGHCEGIIRHEHWCNTLNPGVYYACQIVAEPTDSWRRPNTPHLGGDLGRELLSG
jgi:hypothetical protein